MGLMVTKRTGEVVDFDSARIKNAIQKAVLATNSQMPVEQIDKLVEDVAVEIKERFVEFFPNVENIQDIVEKHLIKNGFYELSKEYILYRARRGEERQKEREKNVEKSVLGKLTVQKRDGRTVLFNVQKVKDSLRRASKGFEQVITEETLNILVKEVLKNLYDGVKTSEIDNALVLGSTAFIEKDPAYNAMSARLFLQKIYKEVMGESVREATLEESYRSAFINGIKVGVAKNRLDSRMLEFDLDQLADAIDTKQDLLLDYLGIKTLYDSYFLKSESSLLELPQAFWMRVAMGLSLLESDKNKKALEFYRLLSSLRFVSSTPTLFHSGLTHAQLSSCYLSTVDDDLNHIFKVFSDNAQLSKWSGGIGNDWSYIRATGAKVKKTNIESQGVIPFLKIASDIVMAVNLSGKRRGGTCAYLETWHLDIEEFLDLRKNTGDDRRRTHDMNTANWIPDLFMKRVMNDENWTLFSPEEVPDLHDLYGRKFEKRYMEYEEMARNGKIRKHKVVSAQKQWKKMLSMLFETGHPWITFKDPCNIRSPQDHVGVVHSSNLCTEITLNTSFDETAVCNLGSINLERHFVDGNLDKDMLAHTVKTAVRMLDNVIDLNFYPTVEARRSNTKHRPIGLGIMGFQDALFRMNLAYDSPEALTFTDTSMEFISYHAILASSELADERGAYESFKGSKWDRGMLPIDTLDLLEEERGMKIIDVSKETTMDWDIVRENIKAKGMRNSNVMAIAPTATISNISGCFPSIEPIYKNLYVKANKFGEFTIVNPYLVEDLKAIGLWNQDMLEQIKYHDGSIQKINNIPSEIKAKYKEAFEIDPLWAIRMTATRAKWIDQAQSHNVFMKGVSGKLLNEIYMYAWKTGMKTTYYLRTLAASQIEKSTLDANKFGFTQMRDNSKTDFEAPSVSEEKPAVKAPKACLLENPDCEACQ
ncbi:MAG TPA: ribonucleoside-diphosphate reductase subunit alpha [Candidatus Nanoarchaeia archaeon]|nr:ribonucleoside-diphosphate reductase subunit alpha [Candidatus Nanoarchaeia archaeon]